MLKEQSKILKAIGQREGVEETGNRKSIIGWFLKKHQVHLMRRFVENKKNSKISLIYVHGSFVCVSVLRKEPIKKLRL